MPSIKQLNQTIEESFTLKSIADALEEVASIKLKKIRKSIERNKDFSLEMRGIFGVLKTLATDKRHLSSLVEKIIEKNSQTVIVVTTSNHRFYGGLTRQLMELFLKTADQGQLRVVIGKNGVDYLKAVRSNLAYQPVVFKDDLPTPAEMQQLIQIIYPYKKIVFVHSEFKTVLSQVPTFIELTGDVSLLFSGTTGQMGTTSTTGIIKPSDARDTRGTLDTFDTRNVSDFILEPELEQILKFFDSQILTLLVESVFLEEELSKTASRLLSMGGAQDNANLFLKQQRKLLSQAKRSIANNRLIGTYATFKMWQESN